MLPGKGYTVTRSYAEAPARFRTPLARAGGIAAAALGPMLLVAAVIAIQRLEKGPFAVPHAVDAAISFTAMLTIYVLHNRYFEHRAPVELRRPAVPQLLWGAMLGIALIALVMVLLALLGLYRFQGLSPTHDDLWTAAIAVLAGATFEELLFRGYFFRWMARWGAWTAIGATSLFFGGAHLFNQHATVFSAIAIAIEAGVLLGAAYWASGNLWFPIGIHMGWNYAEGKLFGVAVSGLQEHGLFAGTLSGPVWLTGGSFGIEASVVAVVVCGAAGGLMAWQCRRIGAVPVR